MRALIVLAGLAAALCAPSAGACGYCVEDKIASAYDHAVVTRAIARQHQVVFLHIDGPVSPGDAARRFVQNAAEATPGVDKGTVRVSLETLTVSFAFDPRRAPLASLQATLDRKLGPARLSLMPLKIIEREAELKTVKR